MDRQRSTDAARVLAFRQRRGWTQKAAAEWYGITERGWRMFEKGERAVPLPMIRRLSEHDIAFARGHE